MHELLKEEAITSEVLEGLLQAREEGKIDFLLVDVREESEYISGHLKGVDMLKPTSLLNQWLQSLLRDGKERTIIFTCRTGARSGQVQRLFRENGHTATLNHTGGIFSYRGKIERE
jgi:rhodanese-related sulfurtransferase